MQKNLKDGQTIHRSTVKARFSPVKEQAELQTELRELAKEVVSGLSALESIQSEEWLNFFVSELFISAREQERREVRRKRQAQGIAEAKAKGVRFGPERRALPDNFEELRQAWRSKQMTLRTAAELCGIPKSTFRDAALRAEMTAD